MGNTAMKGVPVTLLPAGTTTGTGTAIVLPITCNNPRVHMRGTGAIGAGNIIIEEAQTPDFSGTWSQLLSQAAVPLANGVEIALHILGTIGAIRARISVNVTVGSVEVSLTSD